MDWIHIKCQLTEMKNGINLKNKSKQKKKKNKNTILINLLTTYF